MLHFLMLPKLQSSNQVWFRERRGKPESPGEVKSNYQLTSEPRAFEQALGSDLGLEHS